MEVRPSGPWNWVAPLGAALGIAFGVTVLMVTIFTYIAPAIARDLNLSRAEVASALSLYLAVTIFSVPVAGMLADRVGAQRVILGSAVTFAAAIAMIGWAATDRTALQLLFAAAGLAGAGMSPVCFNRIIVHRFIQRRGLALGIALSGTGLGGMVLPWIISSLLAAYGWREALLYLAGSVAAIGLLAATVAGTETSQDTVQPTLPGTGLLKAAASSTFWLLAVGFALFGFGMSAFISQLQDLFGELNQHTAHVPSIHATVGLFTIFGRLMGGYLLDRVPFKFVGAGSALLGALGMIVLAAGGHEPATAFLAAAAIGLCTGAESDVISFAVARVYGLGKFARIYAVQGSIFMIGFAAGPFVGAKVLANQGAVLLLFVCGSLLFASAAILALIGRHAGLSLTSPTEEAAP
jgi:MFS family permease